MHAMWKPRKFKAIYLYATLYVLTLTLPSAVSVYWAFGDMLLNHSNAFALLPKSAFRDIAVVLMLIHQVRKIVRSPWFFLVVKYWNFLIVSRCKVTGFNLLSDHNLRIRVHAALLRLGESNRHA